MLGKAAPLQPAAAVTACVEEAEGEGAPPGLQGGCRAWARCMQRRGVRKGARGYHPEEWQCVEAEAVAGEGRLLLPLLPLRQTRLRCPPSVLPSHQRASRSVLS